MNTRLLSLTYLGVCGVVTLLLSGPPPAQAACVLSVTAGNDVNTCDGGNSGGLTDPGGDNILDFPVGGTGVITGDVTYGAGNDLVQMDSGTLNGSVNQGDGANIFRLFNGQVTGTITQGAGDDVMQVSGGSAGAVSQGTGADSYSQSGGTVASLAQGDGYDTFTMSSGTITGAFEDGDQALMVGGTIGRVDMKLDNNIFDLRGGRIIANLVTGFGNDTILVSGGSIGGNISTSGGDDIITVSGGDIGGQILASFGNDHFTWIDGGLIHGAVTLGPGDDMALLQNLNETILASTPRINGGANALDGAPGIDTLTFDNTQSASPNRYTDWEVINLDNNSRLTLDANLILGSVDSGTGTLNINGSSSLQVEGSQNILAVAPVQLVDVNNKGLVDMTSSGANADDVLRVTGNYNGDNGQMALQSVLGSDGSASDRLVIVRGVVQGSTSINVTNLAGPGAETRQNGIQLVEALDGATGSNDAFKLTNGQVSAGAFNYYLFKGGVSAGTEQNWYLRSTVPTPPDPEDPVGVFPPVPADGTPDLPGVFPGEEPIPIYRPEVPVYAVLFPAVQQMVQAMLGTYHERLGDQSRQQATGTLPAGWGRVYGNSTRQSFAGTVNPRLEGSVSGFQVGTDLYAWTHDDGVTQRLGVFVGHSRLRGSIDGFNGGFQNKDAGKTTLRGDSLGTYWTLIGANRGYIDVVLMGTRFDGNSESDRGVKLKTKGHNVLGSVEVGLPLRVSDHWEVEPQAQVIINRSYLDDQNDGISDVSFKADTNVVTRVGARLTGNYKVSGMPVQPYLRANVWHAGSGTNRVSFNDVTDIDTEQKSTTLELGAGATMQVSSTVSLYGEVGYNGNLDGNQLNGRKGTVGVRVEF